MTQKDKVKELVGRGLHSYHTKSLQQIDRIEKKNKEQNHKISILSNELDNDYLTKTEEGSVISLEHSKEGMIYLDELQGNTLVNYCTDGSKEMTLNGDIDVEGTSVTLTEGVDNGLVDVMCEGNTLVNLKYGQSGSNCTVSCSDNTNNQYFILEENSKLHCKGEVVETARNLGLSWAYYPMGNIRTSLLKPNTTYTVILDNKFDSITSIYLQHGNSSNTVHKSTRKITKDIFTITTKDSFEGITINDNSTILYGSISWDYKGKVDYRIIAFLEGDWSEKEIPNSFFEGMKSVGQDDENGHKIEILSQNKNLFNGEYELGYINISIGYIADPNANGLTTGWIKCKPNTKYIASGGDRNRWLLRNKDGKETIIGGTIGDETPTVTTLSDTTELRCYFRWSSSNEEVESVLNSFQIEEGATRTSYTKGLLNKKEILLNEPLRGLPNGVKDKFIKQSNKWYIERNLCEYKITGEENILTYDANSENAIIQYYITGLPNMIVGTSTVNGISDKFNFIKSSDRFHESSHNHLWCSNSHIALMYLKSANLTTSDVQNLLRGTTVVYQLATPTYEEITDVELITYLDTTHISNNSIIPCNMKIQNTGYNAIIKPNTLYTVALDTNKGGTIGTNLGGAKGTTTNNVLTLTTPATLTDDSLRLYGKGIKGSKVRLLEGDKTNWIPSFFEGMKSSFEDKLQEDGTYKMEILSNNKNLMNLDVLELTRTTILNKNTDGKLYFMRNYGSVQGRVVVNTKIKKGKKYNMSFNVTNIPPTSNLLVHITNLPQEENHPYRRTISNIYLPSIENKVYNTTFVAQRDGYIMFETDYSGSEIQINNLQLTESENYIDYIERKSNKIQFSSIEPLRGINDSIRDKFVFKDNKLMIERNVTERIINGTEVINPNVLNDKVVRIAITHKGNQYKDNKLIKCDGFPSNGDTQSMETAFVATDLLVLSIYKHRLKEKTTQGFINWLKENPQRVQFKSVEPTYEEIPFELQKIILEGYENGTLFFDTNIPPTSTITYAGETPIVKSVKLNKTEVLNNTNDINDNIIPYLMDMDYRVVMLQLATEDLEGGVSMARLFGGTYEMIKRDILSKRLTREEYGYRLADYFNAGKLTEQEVRELEDLR